MKQLSALAVGVSLAAVAHGQAYRCTSPDGGTVFQDRPCADPEERESGKLDLRVPPPDPDNARRQRFEGLVATLPVATTIASCSLWTWKMARCVDRRAAGRPMRGNPPPKSTPAASGRAPTCWQNARNAISSTAVFPPPGPPVMAISRVSWNAWSQVQRTEPRSNVFIDAPRRGEDDGYVAAAPSPSLPQRRAGELRSRSAPG